MITYQGHTLTYIEIPSPGNTHSFKFKIKDVEFDQEFLDRKADEVTLPDSINDVEFMAKKVVERWKGFKG